MLQIVRAVLRTSCKYQCVLRGPFQASCVQPVSLQPCVFRVLSTASNVMADNNGPEPPSASDGAVEESLSRATIADVSEAKSKTALVSSADCVESSSISGAFVSIEGAGESLGLFEPKSQATSVDSDPETYAKKKGIENDALVIQLCKDPMSNLKPKESEDSQVCVASEAQKDCSESDQPTPPTKSKNMIKKELRRALARERKRLLKEDPDLALSYKREKRKADEDLSDNHDIKKAKLETKALKAKRPGFSEERYNETSYFIENGLRKVYPYYFTFTTFTKGRWVGEKILDVFAKEFRAHPAEEYERCIKSGTLTVNYERVDTDCRLKHNDLLANIVHRHEVPVTAASIPLIYTDEDTVVVDKPASIPVHPCGRYRHNTVVFILAKEYNLKNLRTIHRLDRLTSGLLLFGRTPKKAREMEQQIRTRQVTKQYVCRVEGRFPTGIVECNEPIEVVSYKIGVCKVSPTGKDCKTEFQLLSYNGSSSVVLCKPRTGRMHQIRVHLQYLGFPIVNDPLYNHTVFGPNKGKGGITNKTDDELIQDLIKIHNAENWLGMDGDVEYSMFKPRTKDDCEEEAGGSLRNTPSPKDKRGSPSTLSSAATLPTPSPPAVPSPDSAVVPTGGSLEKTDSRKLNEDSRANNGNSDLTLDSSSSPPTPNYYTGNHNYNTTNAGLSVIEHNRFDYSFKPHLKTVDKNCYECKVRYRDPKPKDLVMFLHALKYSGPGWHFETKMPDWAAPDWVDTEDD